MANDKAAQYDIAALKAQYDRDGVVMVPGLVSQDWVQRITVAIAEFRQQDPGDIRSTYFGHGPGRTTIRWMWREHSALLKFAREAGIGGVIGGIMGAKRLKFWYDNIFIHEGGFQNFTREAGYDREYLAGTPWHHDVTAFPFTGEMNASVWVALTPVTADTAPLMCLKGSHRTGKLYRPAVYTDQKAEVADGFHAPPDWEAAIARGEWEKLWWPMQPGDTLLIHPNTIHGAPPAKDGAQTRIGFSTRWAGDDIRWWPHAYAMKFLGIDYKDIAVGSPPDGPYFPLVWQEETR